MWPRRLSLVCVLASPLLLGGALADNPWPSFQTPKRGPARAIGDYASGCLQGARELSLDGPGYQVMRPSRRRFFGHPDLVDFVRGLGRRVRKQRLGVLLVGDLSQVRGGRAAGGHASHQTGLDVDLWYTYPKSALQGPLPASVREEISAESVVAEDGSGIRNVWRRRVTELLRLTVQDARVDRVFVHPVIKRELCTRESERAWLRRIRPWYGHDDHLHVRLACPEASEACKPQAALPEGDGCDKLDFWFDPEAQAARKESQKEYQKTVREGRGWPEQCDALLDARR